MYKLQWGGGFLEGLDPPKNPKYPSKTLEKRIFGPTYGFLAV